ncbi:hypothetical protein YC2023_067662 [Brassica napus]
MDSTKTIKEIGVQDQEQLPWELVEEILTHVPPISLVRFRTVCKRWDDLFNDKTFIDNHKLTFRFILATKSKIYSTDLLYHLINFDFSSERFYTFFCDLPCGMNHPRNALVLPVFKGDRTLSIPNFPGLVSNEYSSSQPSYFIDDKRLVMCSCDETGHPWIYILKENKLISKVKLNSVVDPWPVHCTYFPSLVPVPGSPIEEALLQV